MKNLFAYDFTNHTIVATKATLKKASNPTTDEYKTLIKMIEAQPTFRVVEKVIKNSGNKKTYSGLTLEMMAEYIMSQQNSDKLMAEFNEAQSMISQVRQRPRQMPSATRSRAKCSASARKS